VSARPPVLLDRPWLEMPLGGPCRVLSFTLNRPGLCNAERILWREVRDADLGPETDAAAWLDAALAPRGATGVPCFLTSRNVARFEVAEAQVAGIAARCVATVGLSNAGRVGLPAVPQPAVPQPAVPLPAAPAPTHRAPAGTINLAVACDLPLAEAALIEALTIVAAARTAAVLAHGPDLPAGRATGTGTDCVAVAAPAGETRFAGLHTAQGAAIGRAAFAAVARGTRAWMAEQARAT